MATNIVELDQIPPDIDPLEVGIVLNPFKEDFVHPYAGKDQTIPAATVKIKEKTVEKEVEEEDKEGNKKLVKKKIKEEYEEVTPGRKQYPLYVAVHLAKHIAQRIIREEHRKYLAGIAGEEKQRMESLKPIPDYKGKVWAKMKELVISDSKFFQDKEISERFVK